MIIKGASNTMTDDEIARRMEDLSYLKIQPRDEEENRLALLRAERMYEESIGEKRTRIERLTGKFEEALRKGDRDSIDKAREELYKGLQEDDE